jgi:hypothetical protein
MGHNESSSSRSSYWSQWLADVDEVQTEGEDDLLDDEDAAMRLLI